MVDRLRGGVNLSVNPIILILMGIGVRGVGEIMGRKHLLAVMMILRPRLWLEQVVLEGVQLLVNREVLIRRG